LASTAQGREYFFPEHVDDIQFVLINR
jgi:hypothetical protein